MRKLFISFTSLLALVANQKVSAEDLEDGLFFFGCTRDHAFNPGGKGEHDERKNKPSYGPAHEVIKDVLLAAEREGRVEWHNTPNRERCPWQMLDGLLICNGIPPLRHQPSSPVEYSYPALRDAAEAAKLPIQPVY